MPTHAIGYDMKRYLLRLSRQGPSFFIHQLQLTASAPGATQTLQ
jgi:hypothetical protein